MKKEKEITEIDLINKNLEVINPSLEESSSLVDQNLEKEKLIAFSSKIVKVLKDKTKNHNSKESIKISFEQLKRMFCYSHDLEPDPKEKMKTALTSVNAFIRFSSGSIDLTKGILASEEDYFLANEEIQKYNLNLNFKSTEDLYLNEKASNTFWFDL